ncbi:unnamed protein product [Brassicogethes aeneus]|uniref:Uncharacterized protein n=1 Tax=Brassicogethes aeneus TaxID=1431903 RepID=A0A9P0FG89_BRAAE|nr:unnamed protein product [Brassicogethes aeneus]
MEKQAYKVWNASRTKKICVLLNKEMDNVYENIILEAGRRYFINFTFLYLGRKYVLSFLIAGSKCLTFVPAIRDERSRKMMLNGSALCLEKDGTTLDSDDVIKYFCNEIFMLLTNEEFWVPAQSNIEILSISQADTITDCSTHTLSLSSSILDDKENTNDDQENTNDDQENTNEKEIKNVNYNLLWENFKIPWHLLPKSAKTELENESRKRSIISKVVNIVVEEMREIKNHIPISAFKLVAKKIINKYPRTFQDQDEDNEVFGDGIGTLVSKLVDHNNYLNRPHKTKQNSGNSLKIKKRKVLIARAGCPEWEASASTSVEPSNELENYELDNSEFTDDFLTKYLEAHYSKQRDFLNKLIPPTVHQIKATWPVFENVKYISLHFHKLTKTNLDNFLTSLQQKSERLVNYAIQQKYIEKTEENLSIQALKFFGNYFKENLSEIFYTFEENTSEIEIANKITINECCVVELGSIPWVFYQKYAFIKCDTFLQAVTIMFGLYFILNLRYPRKTQVFMEFLQRYLLKIHPDSGSKSNDLAVKKVRRFVNKLKDIP